MWDDLESDPTAHDELFGDKYSGGAKTAELTPAEEQEGVAATSHPGVTWQEGAFHSDMDPSEFRGAGAAEETSFMGAKGGPGASGATNDIENQIQHTSSAMEENANSAREAADRIAGEAGESLAGLGGGEAGSMLAGLGRGLSGLADILGPAAAMWGGIEAAKEIAHVNAGGDPYSAVEGIIGKEQGVQNHLNAAISSDQFAEKVGSARPSFGSLAAPVFTTVGGGGGGGSHF